MRIEPRLNPGARVRLEYLDGMCLARATFQPDTARDDKLGFKHICHIHGGEYLRRFGGYAVPLEKFVAFVEYLGSQEAEINPSSNLKLPLLSVANDLKDRLDKAYAIKLPFPLHPFQIEGRDFLCTHKRAFLWDEMGLGKTIQLLAALPPDSRGIIVCPASLRLNWQAEGKKWRPDFVFTVCRKTKECRLPEPGEYVIMSPEGASKWVQSDEKAAKLMERPQMSFVSDCVLVVDEGHYFKNPKSQRSKALTLLSDVCPISWVATGTPMMNKPPDLIGVLRTFGLFKQAFATRWYLEKQFGMTIDRDGTPRWPAKVKHAPAIVRSLSRVAIRRERKDVLKDVPPKTYADVLIDLRDCKVKVPNSTKEELELYKAVDQGGIEVVPFESFAALAETRALLAEAKVPHVEKFCERFLEENIPLVVASFNLAPLIRLEDMGFPVIRGSVSANRKHEFVGGFQAGKTGIIGIQVQSGGTGITLTRAHHMLMVQRDWSPAVNAQAEDRLARIGQKADSCVIYDMLANHPLDAILSRNLRDKQTRINATVNQVHTTITSGRKLEHRMRELANYIH